MRRSGHHALKIVRPSRWGAVVLLGLLWGCGGAGSDPRDPEVAAFLGIPSATPIHRFDLVDRQGRVGLFPRTLDVAPGHWVQFVAADTRVYSVHFDRERFEDEAAWAFLQGLHQTASPPLTGAGARFIVSFEEAPPGTYPFRIEGQGVPVAGEIRVRAR
jgi:plastocyanin